MSFTTRIDSDRRLSYVLGSGTVTFDDLAAAQRTLANDPAFDPTFPVLIDLRTVNDVRLTRQEMQSLVGISAAAPSTRRAILVGTPGVLGLARLYEALRENQTTNDVVRACQTIEEAISWLGVDQLDV